MKIVRIPEIILLSSDWYTYMAWRLWQRESVFPIHRFLTVSSINHLGVARDMSSYG